MSGQNPIYDQEREHFLFYSTWVFGQADHAFELSKQVPVAVKDF